MGAEGPDDLHLSILDITVDADRLQVRTRGSVQLPEPSFLVVLRDGTDDAIMTLSETAEGAVTTLAVRDGAFVQTRPCPPVATGAFPCHLAVSPDGSLVAVAEYGSGGLTMISVANEGHARTHRLRLPAGHGPVADRQDRPHAHFVHWVTPSRLLLTDLGCDRLLDITIKESGEAAITGSHSFPGGSGPRHLVISGGMVLVVGELDARLHVLDSATLAYRGSISLQGRGRAGTGQPSHVGISADGAHAYVANRGRDTISVFTLGDSGPDWLCERSCGGLRPRHFLATDTLLLVANQHSDAVAVLPLEDGIPGPPIGQIPHRRASCVVRMETFHD